MKLRNKKTGEIMDDVQYRNYSLSDGFGFRMNGKEWEYHSLAELNAEWEDYEEPKTFWAISWAGEPEEYDAKKTPQELKDMTKQIGNYFDTREEAEKAVEKLKAWKRLKDKGFRFERWYWDDTQGHYILEKIDFVMDEYDGAEKDLDLLFSGGEE